MKFKIKYLFIACFIMTSATTLKAQIVNSTDTVNKADKDVNVLFRTQKYSNFVGNMSVVKGDNLTTHPAIMVNEALAGQLPGVFMRQNSGAPGSDNFTISVRGNIGGYIVLVDGVERSLSQYDTEQIEDIKVLKDPVSKALYGGRMCNGIIMVTTKRGKNAKNELKFNIHRGLKQPTRLPGYLNSYDFATKYNEAIYNDGITTGKYTQAQLSGFKNHSNPYQYPDVNYYDEFLNKFMDITRVSTEYTGGTDKTKYYVHGSYQNEGGLEKYGNKKTGIDVFNLQGNIDTQFSDKVLLHSSIGSYVSTKIYPSGFNFSTLSSRYPNAYPIFAHGDSLGGTNSYVDNPYAAQAKSGYVQENHLRVRGDLGLEFKLDDFIEGLSIKPTYSFDTYHKQNLTKINRPAIYSINSFDVNGNPVKLNTIQTEQLATTQSFGDDDYINSWMFTNTVSYDRKFGAHSINTDLVYYISNASNAGDKYDYKRQNLGLRTNYSFLNKYTLEGVVNYVGSQSYPTNNKFKLFPAIGAGWLLSKEDFIKKISEIDYLKLNASWGLMGDGNIAANLWRQTWISGPNYYFNTSSSSVTTQLNNVQNLTLNWPVQQQIDLSLEMNLFKSIYAKLSYFDYVQSGLLSRGANTVLGIVGGISGLTSFNPYVNYEKNKMNGVEAEFGYEKRFKDFSIKVGTHFTYSQTKRLVVDEATDPNFSYVGTAMNAIWGYRFAGYYSQTEIDQLQAGSSSLPQPSFVDSKSLKVGNLKYADINGDGTIDKYDMQAVGNSSPDLMYGGDLNIGYKGFNIYVMLLGYSKYNYQLNNSYYQIYSTRKYSNVLVNGLPNGNPHPLLTTSAGTNDFQTSDYWIVNGSFLKIKDLALSYSFPKNITKSLHMKDLKLTLYGSNLYTISRVKDSDPESINAGINDFPLFSTYSMGISIIF